MTTARKVFVLAMAYAEADDWAILDLRHDMKRLGRVKHLRAVDVFEVPAWAVAAIPRVVQPWLPPADRRAAGNPRPNGRAAELALDGHLPGYRESRR